ncbi:hypothetical protein ACLBYG_22075 [Methylobacterium sp. D53M]
MCWPSFFIGLAVGLALAGAAWALASSHRALKAEDAARAASDRTEIDPEKGSAISIRASSGEVLLELGTMRNVGGISADAWASLSPSDAREVAADLVRTAAWLERPRG